MESSIVPAAPKVSQGVCLACPRERGLRRPRDLERGRRSSFQLLLLILAAFCFSEGCGWMPRYLTRSTRSRMTMNVPRTTLKKHTKVPVPTPGRDLMSLQVNEKLVGRVVGFKEVGSGRRVFVDVDVTRKGRGDLFYPVFGMIRMLGRYANMSVSLGQQFECHVDAVNDAAGRLTCSLTPVFRRPDVNETTGAALPTYELTDLKCGMPLTGMVVSNTDNFAYLDCGVVQSVGVSKPRRINGRLYRLDLQERFALAPKFKGPKTEALITPGMIMQAYVRNVFPDSNAYRLTVDPEITPEKAEAEQKERDEQRAALKDRKDVDKLVIGTLRTGVITKVLPDGGGVKVGIGAKNTGFVPISSLADALGKEIKDLSKVVTVGGQLEVEIEEIDDEDRILLRCLRILKQPKPGAKKGAKKAATKTQKKKYENAGEDDWSYDDVY